MKEFIESADLKKGSLIVIGCSSSEIIGSKIGSNSAYEVAEAVFEGIKPLFNAEIQLVDVEYVKKNGIYASTEVEALVIMESLMRRMYNNSIELL